MAALAWLALFLLGAGAVLLALAWRTWRAGGLPKARVVATDTRGWRRPSQPYYSPTWDLAGRPDYVLHHRGSLIPVEVKGGRTPREPYEGHMLQLGAYCLLLEEAEGRAPPYGLLRYPEATFRVPFDGRLRRRVVEILEEMRAAEARGGIARGHQEPWRCRACGYRDVCDQRLEGPSGGY